MKFPATLQHTIAGHLRARLLIKSPGRAYPLDSFVIDPFITVDTIQDIALIKFPSLLTVNSERYPFLKNVPSILKWCTYFRKFTSI